MELLSKWSAPEEGGRRKSKLKSRSFENLITKYMLMTTHLSGNLIFFKINEPLVQWFYPSSSQTGPKGQRSGVPALVLLMCWTILFASYLGEMSTDPLTTQSGP